MSHYFNERELEDQPLHLTDEQVQSPYQVLEKLCADFTLAEVRRNLFESVKVCMTGENDIFRNNNMRAQAFNWYVRAQAALEAVFVMVKDRQSIS